MTPTDEDLLSGLNLLAAQEALKAAPLRAHWDSLFAVALARLRQHGHFQKWWSAAQSLPLVEGAAIDLSADTPVTPIGTEHEQTLRALCPWKKGPFQMGDLHLDAEWRSDLKWQRVSRAIAPLSGRRVLDVGTGNGYFLLRALGDGAEFVLGLEPSVLFSCQYAAVQRLFGVRDCALLPLTSEEFCADCRAFDTVLSMGVLYHRKSPLDHLTELKSFLKPGGQLVLETLVVEGPLGHSLVPADRYAKMRNVWFLPSVPTLVSWLERLGFKNVKPEPIVPTTEEEQRMTSWSGEVSLRDFLDPSDPSKTIEGHPAPKRVIITADSP